MLNHQKASGQEPEGSRLQTLFTAGSRARVGEKTEFSDSAEGLSPGRRKAWASFLCSIATTESIEGRLLEPVVEALGGSEPARLFLSMQSEDERRHHLMLTGYVKRTFGYEKKGRSASDVLVYETLMPMFSRWGRSRPLVLLTALRFYEAFSLHFYRRLKAAARADGLGSLVSLVQAIEKDEAIHLAGLETLVHGIHREKGKPSRLDALAIRSILELLLFDIDIRPMAFHNRRVRRNAMILGIDPHRMRRDARGAARDAVGLALKGKR